ncbi:MAG: hypothetical protein D3918_13105 [Candidatus Electrothrix sp. AX2]|nr:hypothetical protein [Candidatus Electrothrix gigas]
MNYDDWEERFLNANQEHYKHQMKLYELEDKGETSGDRYNSWARETRQWKKTRDHFIEEYPKFHEKYVHNRGKPSQTKLSAKYNGGKSKSGGGWFVWVVIIAGVLWLLSK